MITVDSDENPGPIGSSAPKASADTDFHRLRPGWSYLDANDEYDEASTRPASHGFRGRIFTRTEHCSDASRFQALFWPTGRTDDAYLQTLNSKPNHDRNGFDVSLFRINEADHSFRSKKQCGDQTNKFPWCDAWLPLAPESQYLMTVY